MRPTKYTLMLTWPLVVAVLLFCREGTLADSPNDILVIANKNVPIDAISIDELRILFLKKRESWPNGQKIVPVNASKSKSLRVDFQQHVLHMSPTEEESYWHDQRVRQGLDPPPEFSKQLKAVYKLRGSISYIYRKDYIDNLVKILFVIPQ